MTRQQQHFMNSVSLADIILLLHVLYCRYTSVDRFNEMGILKCVSTSFGLYPISTQHLTAKVAQTARLSLSRFKKSIYGTAQYVLAVCRV